MPEFQIIALLLGTGLVIGILSGLLGIGGGIIMTPVQYWIYTSGGMSTDVAIKLSFATTLAVVLPTAASGVLQHRLHTPINWRFASFMGIFTALGSFIGSSLAVYLPGSALKIGFGVLALIVTVRMISVKMSISQQPVRTNRWLWIAIALPLGIVTGLLGIGGGILVIPVLVLILHLQMKNAVATSLAMMLFTATGGIIGYAVAGTNVQGLPAQTLGFIYWPAWIGLSITSIGMAQVGAILAHKLQGNWLNYLFIALLIYVSLDMLGLFEFIASLFG